MVTRMFKHFLLPVLSLTVTLCFGQHVGPGHHCRAGKQLGTTFAPAASTAADSIHIQHYDIRIDSLNFSQQRIWGVTGLTVESKVDGLTEVPLSLDGFTVDSIVGQSGANLNYTYDGLNLKFELQSAINIGETDTISVFYHGNPAQDPSGWGGYYWNGSAYAFNMGVGFDEDPHVFGRAWFPCLDVFTDRATYDFHIRVFGNYKAFCNGTLEQTEDHDNGAKTFHWNLDQTIPTYLASMAVANYHFLEREYSGIPTVWAAVASDTVAVLSTFQHMNEAVQAFISSYGPYRWDKIGYALVPFNSGAMEHASSIHIGRPFVDGSLSYETLWAHELAHMWWGDLVTCEDQENMWLNEGFAAYSEALFTEVVYGQDAYRDWIRDNHRKVLQFAHVTDGNYYAMNEIPHEVTYGSTVYEKGPDVIHTLRNHMGDPLFFAACSDYMDSLAFGNANSHDLRNVFAVSSGMNLDPFFDGWVFEGGFPHWQIDSYSVTPVLNAFEVTVHLRHKQRANNHVYGMKIPINLTDGIENFDVTVEMTQETQSFTVTCPFEPKMAIIDRWEKMSDAIADFEMVVNSAGNKTFKQTNVTVDVETVGNGPSIVRIADHFVQPDGFMGQNPGLALNPYHYWSVDGIFADGLEAEATFKFNGTTNTSQGFMDNDLIIDTEDSLVFLYRPFVGTEWQEVEGYEVVTGSSVTNKIGTVRIDTLKIGDYVLARRDFTAGTGDLNKDLKPTFAYPNPNSGLFNVNLPEGNWSLELLDLAGKRLANWNATSGQQINTGDVAKGQYMLRAANGLTQLSQSIIIQ